MKPRTHGALPVVEQDRQYHRGLDQRHGQSRRHVARLPRERRDHDKQRYHGEILKQQHADHLPAVQRIEFELVGEHFADNRG